MRVDNTSQLKFGDNRESIHIHTRDRFTVGSVWIVDMLHVPYGVCHVPQSGYATRKAGVTDCCTVSVQRGQRFGQPRRTGRREVKLIHSKVSTWSHRIKWLCTLPPWVWHIPSVPYTGNHLSFSNIPFQGCNQVNPVQSSTLINSTNCDYQANFNEGCVVTDPNPNSYGEAFAQAGGGIFVTEFAETGISWVDLFFFVVMVAEKNRFCDVRMKIQSLALWCKSGLTKSGLCSSWNVSL